MKVVRGTLADFRSGLEFDYDDDKRNIETELRVGCPLGGASFRPHPQQYILHRTETDD